MADDVSVPAAVESTEVSPVTPAESSSEAPAQVAPEHVVAMKSDPDPAPEPAAMAPEPEMQEEASPAPPPEPEEPPEPPANKKRWYVVKVQSGREDTIKEAIERRVRKERLEEFYGQIVIPVEKVTEVKVDAKNNKRVTRTKERKLYPGYLMCEVEYNDRILYLFRETSGVGDFVGAQPGNPDRPPTPMSEREIQRMMGPTKGTDEPTVAPPPKDLSVGDRVKVVDGTFNGMEGSVKQILEKVAKVQVELTIFGRPVTVELEYYQVEQA